MQGKSDRQKKDSTRFASYGLFGLIVVVFMVAIANLVETKSDTTHLQGPPSNYWVPTVDDILYQDSMYAIIKQTETNMDTINQGMERILLKLDIIIYQDGTSDSVRLYEENHVTNYNEHTNEDKVLVTPLYPDEDVMWIGGNGDIIYD